MAKARSVRFWMPHCEKGSGIGDQGSGQALSFELKASKGVIVRALAQDMGATLMSLRRTKIG